MSVYYNYSTGNPRIILPEIIRRVSAYTRISNVRNFKIGITNNPDRRWSEEHSFSYDEMLVVYMSSSIENVSWLEFELINHNELFCENINSGGGGNIGPPPYHLYIVAKYI